MVIDHDISFMHQIFSVSNLIRNNEFSACLPRRDFRFVSYLLIIENGQYAETVAQRCSVKKGVFRNFAKFTGKNLCQSLFFSKVAGLCCKIFINTFFYRKLPVASKYFGKKNCSSWSLSWWNIERWRNCSPLWYQ